MAKQLFANNATGYLNSSITNVATSITLQAGQGASFPSPTGSDYFYATLFDGVSTLEIVKVTARSTDTLTVTRAQEGTTASTFASGAKFEVRITAAGLNNLAQKTGDTITDVTITTLTNLPTVSAATANTVPYFNGSKVVTSGTALQFDGTKFGIGVTPTSMLTIGAGTFTSAATQTSGMYTNGTSGLVILTDALSVNTRTGGSLVTLDTSGNFMVGQAINGNQNANGFSVNAGIGGTYFNHISGTVSGQGYASFCYNGAAIGSITQNGTTATSFNTTSDHRLKTNVRPADAKQFMNIQFRDFEWIDGRHDCGVIAHELQAIYPDLVIGEKDAVDEKGKPVYQQVNYIGLIGRMGAVIQSLSQRIAVLEGKV